MNKKEKNKMVISTIDEIIESFSTNEIVLEDLSKDVFSKIKNLPYMVSVFHTEKEWKKKISFYCSSRLKANGWVKVGKRKQSPIYRRF